MNLRSFPILRRCATSDEVSRHPSWSDGVKRRTSANCLVVRIVLGWEEMVMKEDEKQYVRVYSWFKLVKLWAALRWDDTMGIPPDCLELVKDKGIKGKIVRSKTSGEGRRVEMQEFYVAFDCWLERRGWLLEGWRLFFELGAGYGNSHRDFLLPRPDRHLQGFRGAMVKYPEAMAMSRALLGALKRPDEEGVLKMLLISIPESTAFWSEHSERITMISWAAALGVEPDARKRWGRWRPTTDEEYAKTTQSMFMAAQGMVARKIREALGGPSLLEDDEVLLELGKWLEERGFLEHQIDEQLKRLRLKPGRKWRREEHFDSPAEWGGSHGHSSGPSHGEGGEADGLDGPAPNTPACSLGSLDDRASPSGVAAPSPMEAAGNLLDFAEQLMVEPDAQLPVSKGTFVLSVVGRSKRRTLHQVGSCYRQPGVHYKEYLVVGDVRPVLEKGERLCISCFGKRDQVATQVGVINGDSSDSASSVSSSTSLGSTSSEDP